MFAVPANPGVKEAQEMTVSNESEYACSDCGIKITGVPVVLPTHAQIEKLKPTVYLCTECAKDRGLLFDTVAIGRTGIEAPSPAP